MELVFVNNPYDKAIVPLHKARIILCSNDLLSNLDYIMYDVWQNLDSCLDKEVSKTYFYSLHLIK